jgi:hypothetical protein
MAADQINNRVGIQVAFAQKKLARNTSRDAAAQKTLALLGAIFLPGAYLSVSLLNLIYSQHSSI